MFYHSPLTLYHLSLCLHCSSLSGTFLLSQDTVQQLAFLRCLGSLFNALLLRPELTGSSSPSASTPLVTFLNAHPSFAIFYKGLGLHCGLWLRAGPWFCNTNGLNTQGTGLGTQLAFSSAPREQLGTRSSEGLCLHLPAVSRCKLVV